jgi:hypothetical protein
MRVFGYGGLTKAQEDCLREVVRGRRVHDLGASTGTQARLLLGWGALEVNAIDKEDFSASYKEAPSQLKFERAYFEDYTPGAIDLAFVSWPANYNNGLVKLVRQAKTVVYLGKNTDSTMCGYPQLFEHFITRKLVSYVPDYRNTLIVLGEPLAKPRTLQGEEWAGISAFNGQRPLTYEEAERLSALPGYAPDKPGTADSSAPSGDTSER